MFMRLISLIMLIASIAIVPLQTWAERVHRDFSTTHKFNSFDSLTGNVSWSYTIHWKNRDHQNIRLFAETRDGGKIIGDSTRETTLVIPEYDTVKYWYQAPSELWPEYTWDMTLYCPEDTTFWLYITVTYDSQAVSDRFIFNRQSIKNYLKWRAGIKEPRKHRKSDSSTYKGPRILPFPPDSTQKDSGASKHDHLPHLSPQKNAGPNDSSETS